MSGTVGMLSAIATCCSREACAAPEQPRTYIHRQTILSYKIYQYLANHLLPLITATTRQGIDLLRESNGLVVISIHDSSKHLALLFLTAAGPP